jgi:hypothetical protein
MICRGRRFVATQEPARCADQIKLLLEGKRPMRKVALASSGIALALALGLSACTNPYDPGQCAIGGGLLGAGAGVASGDALGAITGAATTPPPLY